MHRLDGVIAEARTEDIYLHDKLKNSIQHWD